MNPEVIKNNPDAETEQQPPQETPEISQSQPDLPAITQSEFKEQETAAAKKDQAELEELRSKMDLNSSENIAANNEAGKTETPQETITTLEAPTREAQPAEGVTRRGFIGTMSKALLGAFLTGAETTRSEAKESKESEDPKYKKGIETLRKFAESGGPEHMAYYVKKADGTSEWIDSGAQNAESSLIDLSIIEHHKNDAEIELIHSHPSPEFPMPPSTQDIITEINIKNNQKDGQAKLKFKVVDSTGTYDYIADGANEIIRDMAKIQSKSGEFMIRLMEDKGYQEFAKDNQDFIKDLQTMDPASAGIEFMKQALNGAMGQNVRKMAAQENSSIPPKVEKLMEELVSQEKATSSGITLGEHQREIKKLMKLWKKNGVTINFTPHRAEK